MNATKSAGIIAGYPGNSEMRCIRCFVRQLKSALVDASVGPSRHYFRPQFVALLVAIVPRYAAPNSSRHSQLPSAGLPGYCEANIAGVIVVIKPSELGK
jgi:hypothetical protein